MASQPALQRPIVGNQIRTWLRRITNVLVVVPRLSFKQNGAVSAAFPFPPRSSAISHFRPFQLSSASKSTSSSPSGAAYNHLLNVTRLSNDFFAVRHGQSTANVARLIASNPATATSSYGLTTIGRAAAENAARQAIKVYRDAAAQQKSYQGILILSSDLLRAKETATILANTIIRQDSIPLYIQDAAANENNSSGIVLDVRLRERWFGAWDGTSDENYAAVWADDAMVGGSAHTNHGVESVDSVMDRATACIVEWNDILSAKTKETSTDASSSSSPWMVLCVAHGDVLQILQTAFEKKNGRHHRSLPHLETAQLRPLVLASSDG